MKKRILVSTMLTIVLMVLSVIPAKAATTADVTVTATPSFVSLSCNQASYDFGVVAASGTPSTATNWATVTNSSTIETDVTVSVTGNTWSGGVTWTHSDTATAGADTVGLKVNVGGTWGVGDIIVKFAAPNDIVTNQAALTNFSFGIKLMSPTSFSDAVEKTNVIRLTMAAS